MNLAYMMKPLGLPRIFMIASLTALFVSYLGIWLRFINDPVERTGSDFIGFYSVGRIARHEGQAHVYDPLLQQSIQERVVGFPLAPGQVLLNQHLPFLIPSLEAVSGPDYVASFYVWVSIMLLLYVLSIVLLGRILKQSHLDDSSIRLINLGGILCYPLFFSLLNGQDTALLVLGAAIWVFCLLSGKEWLAGLGLSLATVRPHIVLLLAIPLFFRYRKAFWGFALGSAVLAIISYFILGLQGTLDFIDILLISVEGTWYGLNENAMFNLTGLLLRLFPSLGTDVVHLIGWAVYGLTLVFLCFLWARNRDLHDGRIGLSIVLALFVAQHLHFHDLTLLLIPIYELVWRNKESRKTPFLLAAPAAISILLLISNLTPLLQYTLPYLIMLGLALSPYFLGSPGVVTEPHRS
jgi:hypothetical protein